MLIGVWSEVEPSVEIESADDLNRFIDHAEAMCQCPTAISVEAHGYRADLLVGHDQSFVHLTPEDSDLHSYQVTVGGSGEGRLDCWLHSWHHSEIEARHLIPKQLAREAFCEFVQSGKLSASVQWEQYAA
jgi:Immunity protein Imm1